MLGKQCAATRGFRNALSHRDGAVRTLQQPVQLSYEQHSPAGTSPRSSSKTGVRAADVGSAQASTRTQVYLVTTPAWR